MRKTLWLGALALASVSMADVLAQTGFESGYNVGNLGGQNGWTSVPATSGFNVAAGNTPFGNQHVTISTTGFSNSANTGHWIWLDTPYTPTVERPIVRSAVWVNVTENALATNASVFGLDVYGVPGGGGLTNIATMQVQSNGVIAVFNGVTGTPGLGFGPVPLGNWYLVDVRADFSDQTLGFFVSGIKLDTSSETDPPGTSSFDVFENADTFSDADLWTGRFLAATNPAGGHTGRFDEYFVETLKPGTIRGNVTLNEFDPTKVAGQIVDVQLRDLTTNEPVATYPATLDALGNFEVQVTERGDFFIAVKGSHWLAQRVNFTDGEGVDFAVTKFGVFDLGFELINGDVNGDNEVNLDDYFDLADSYRLGLGDDGFNPNADLDGSEFVDLDDYFILADSFRVIGD